MHSVSFGISAEVRQPDKDFKFHILVNGQMVATMNVKAASLDSAKYKAAQAIQLQASAENNVPTFEL